MRKRGKNLFVEAAKEVTPVSAEVADVNIKTEQKGKTMKRKDVVIADNPKNKADTLYKLDKRVDAKVDFFKKMEDEMSAEVFKLKAEARVGVDLSKEMVTVPTMKWDSNTKTEFMEDVVMPKLERLTSLEKMVSSIGAEIRRLEFAKTQIAHKAVEPGASGHELYRLSPAVVKNDTTVSSYPSQEFKALNNSLGLMKSVAYEIRNVILERLNADLYTKKNAGYFQRDARNLKIAATEQRKMLRTKDWKLGYDLSQ